MSGLVVFVILFVGGLLLVNNLPKEKSLTLGYGTNKLVASISNLNFCKKTVTVSATTRPTAPVCVERPWWCVGSPIISNVSGSWSNGSPGWSGYAPLYGLATYGVAPHTSCAGQSSTFDNGGVALFFYEPSNTAAMYADNKGSHTFDVKFNTPKLASITVNSPTAGQIYSSGNIQVSWTPNPAMAFSSFEVTVGVSNGAQVVRATKVVPAGATSATVSLNISGLPAGQSTGFASVKGNLVSGGGYSCIIQDGGESSLSSSTCYGETNFSVKK